MLSHDIFTKAMSFGGPFLGAVRQNPQHVMLEHPVIAVFSH